MKSAPLFGLVLAGGFSRRMGRDKALLDYHGEPQAIWTARRIAPFCECVYLSCREGQELGGDGGFPRLHDDGGGPLGGMLAAAHRHPQVAWLVVACDLPRLTPAAIDELVRGREGDATAFRSSSDGLPEPLCAIYEPRFLPVWKTALAQDRRCPRKLLIEHSPRVMLLDPSDPRALDNANTPEDFQTFQP